MSTKYANQTAVTRNKRRGVKAIARLHGCESCGSTENLEWNHKDSNNKSFLRSKCSHSWSRLLDEMDKCNVLCKDCHHDTTHKGSYSDIIQYENGWAFVDTEKGSKKKPVTVDGVPYESMTAVSKALNVSYDTVQNRVGVFGNELTSEQLFKSLKELGYYN